MPYSAAAFKTWAGNAYTHYSDETKTTDWAMTMTVSGIPEGSTATMTVALNAVFGVSSAAQ